LMIHHYLISLCNAAQQSEEPFGVVVRIGMSSSQFKAPTTKVIHCLLSFSPAPDTMAVEFLNELGKVPGIESLVDPVLRRASPLDCATWAREVTDFLSANFTKDERSAQLQPVVDIATHMFSHLLIAKILEGRKPLKTVHTPPQMPTACSKLQSY